MKSTLVTLYAVIGFFSLLKLFQILVRHPYCALLLEGFSNEARRLMNYLFSVL